MPRLPPEPAPAEALSAALSRWYAGAARSLPWRADPSPYHVLVSELMAQQTRLETVVARFERFVRRWPDLASLAAAGEDEVLHEWAGLGYYARARHLHAAARAAHAAGGLPSDPEDLRKLPGIGPYTAGAIASLAFGVRAPLVDGNVERVLSRVDGREADPRSASGKRALWARAADLVAYGDPRVVNQGLMELGALVCTPRTPRCDGCPWSPACVGRARGIAADLPRKAPKAAPRPVRAAAAIVARGPRLLMGRRPAKGLLAGLWEPVGAEVADGEGAAAGLRRGLRERLGLDVAVGARLGEVVHVFSHRRLALDVFEARADGEPRAVAFYVDLAWAAPRDAEALGLSALARKTLALADSPAQPSLPLDGSGLLAAEPGPE